MHSLWLDEWHGASPILSHPYSQRAELPSRRKKVNEVADERVWYVKGLLQGQDLGEEVQSSQAGQYLGLEFWPSVI